MDLYLFLGRPQRIEYRISELKRKRGELESRMLPSGIRYDTDRVQTSPGEHMTDTVSEIDDIDIQISRLESMKRRSVGEIYVYAHKYCGAIHAKVITQRYCDLKSFGEIAASDGVTKNCVKQRHKRAICILKSMQKP